MRVTYAQFNIEVKKKFYAVQITPQSTSNNVTSCSVTVVRASDNKTILTRSIAGRQIVSPWNAKEILRSVLENMGEVKPRKKAPNSNYPVGTSVELVDNSPITEDEKKAMSFKGPELSLTVNPTKKEIEEIFPETVEPVSETIPSNTEISKKKKTLPKEPTVRKSKRVKEIEAGIRSGWDPKPEHWKSKAGDEPNSSGVYLYADQEISLDKKKGDPFACIHVLELETGRFISSYAYQLNTSGGSGPLTAHETFSSRAAAIEDALLSIKKASDKDDKLSPKLRKWVDTIYQIIDLLAKDEPQRIQLYEWLTDEEVEADLSEGQEPEPVKSEKKPRKKRAPKPAPDTIADPGEPQDLETGDGPIIDLNDI